MVSRYDQRRRACPLPKNQGEGSPFGGHQKREVSPYSGEGDTCASPGKRDTMGCHGCSRGKKEGSQRRETPQKPCKPKDKEAPLRPGDHRRDFVGWNFGSGNPLSFLTQLTGGGKGEMMVAMVLLLLLWEGREDSYDTILTLLIFLLL